MHFVPKNKSYRSHLVRFMLENIKIIETIYRCYDSAPVNSYMYQFALPYGLKNDVVISLLELIVIE